MSKFETELFKICSCVTQTSYMIGHSGLVCLENKTKQKRKDNTGKKKSVKNKIIYPTGPVLSPGFKANMAKIQSKVQKLSLYQVYHLVLYSLKQNIHL